MMNTRMFKPASMAGYWINTHNPLAAEPLGGDFKPKQRKELDVSPWHNACPWV